MPDRSIIGDEDTEEIEDENELPSLAPPRNHRSSSLRALDFIANAAFQLTYQRQSTSQNRSQRLSPIPNEQPAALSTAVNEQRSVQVNNALGYRTGDTPTVLLRVTSSLQSPIPSSSANVQPQQLLDLPRELNDTVDGNSESVDDYIPEIDNLSLGELKEFLQGLHQESRLKSLPDGSITGELGRLTFQTNFLERKKRSFLYIGQLVVLSIIQDGPWIPVFADCVVDYILNGKVVTVNPDDLQDTVREILDKMRDCATDYEAQFQYSLVFDAPDSCPKVY
ncbi:hypothetical protein KP79_PYT20892 [Mizuhopecten yessoensis]|uniref:Uncharacterized protein n=1 Tax=Mizuhopecten yessoensis TaxID=6573 RepID=A0A210Q4C7_MIZYE|nr:hypothetical protein KP79_PYT20892 [Mizuhopecten yessoensis]